MFLLLKAAASCIALGQWAPGAPSDLIRVMATTPGERLMITVTCRGTDAAAAVPREAARKLAGLGRSALPEIERAIASVERDGGGSMHFNATGWLALAYAKADGAAAYRTLRRLLDDPRLEVFRHELVGAITLSLHLTGYVDRSVEPDGGVCRATEPRDALAKLIFARETGDREMLEESLGPPALSALQSVPSKDLVGLSGGAKVGFRLENRGRWSQPDASLEDPSTRVYEPFPDDVADKPIQTEFIGASGRSCGRIELQFVRVRPGYLINDGEVAALLRMIGDCAVR